jgi:hypothetical protein
VVVVVVVVVIKGEGNVGVRNFVDAAAWEESKLVG